MKRTVGAIVGAALVAIGGWSGVASAHVTIDTLGSAEPGGFVKLVFAVPNERDNAKTVKLEVQLPKDHRLQFVSVQFAPGWDITTTTVDDMVDTITWTAVGDTAIGPHEFAQFWVSVGPLPDQAGSLAFPTLQTYSDGEVVRWIEPTPASGQEPEHPVPTLTIAAATAAGDDDGDDESSLATPAFVLACAALGLGVVALVSRGGWPRSRRPAARPPA